MLQPARMGGFRAQPVPYCGSMSGLIPRTPGDRTVTRRVLLFVLPALILATTLADTRAADDHPVVALVKSKVKDPTKPFALVVSFQVAAGKEKDLEAACASCIAATKKEPGCIAYELNLDTDHPDTYVMFEKFKSVAALEAHIKEKHTDTLLKSLGTMIKGEPKIKVYTAPVE